MGGLKITDNPPAPQYSFEMLYADTDELFLHFKVTPLEIDATAQSATRSVQLNAGQDCTGHYVGSPRSPCCALCLLPLPCVPNGGRARTYILRVRKAGMNSETGR